MGFEDTRMFEPLEEEFFDISEKILKLSDALSEEIILKNIEEQLEEKLDIFNEKINYVSLFKEKYSEIQSDDDFYDKDYMISSLTKVAELVATGIKNRYGVELGEDLDFTNPSTYLEDLETLYEFLFIRHYENLVLFIKYKLEKDKNIFVNMFDNDFQNEEHSKDLFVVQAKKKFKNEEDVLIIHFLTEIIKEIISEGKESSYILFDTIVNLDLFEETNNKMYELIQNYGNKLVLNNDSEIAEKYFLPLNEPSIFSEVRNAILMSYLESCELND